MKDNYDFNDYKWWLNNHNFDIKDSKLWCDLLSSTKQAVDNTSKLNVSDDTLNKALIPLSDVEGEPGTFLIKLKQANVIKEVKINSETHKLEIVLNPDFCGTIAFCGDLTSYKLNNDNSLHVHRYGNEMIIELFEELLAQIKEHNKNKEKDKQIQFVAVPGNHEFYNFQALDDNKAMLNYFVQQYGIDCGSALLVKLRGLKVIAEIQKYFLKQAQTNGDDIKDEDYDDYDDNTDNNTYIAEKKEALQNDIDWLDCHISNIISYKNKNLQAPDYILNEIAEIVRSGKMPNTFNTLPQFNWTSSALLPKIVFSHHGRKFRILHSFALFTPEEYLKLDNSGTNNVASHTIYVNDQQQIFKNAFKQGVRNVAGVNIKDFPDKTVFANNKIPTFVGHEGTKHKTGNYVDLKPQSSLVFCIDESGFAQGGYTYVLGDDNTLYGYVVRKGQNMKEMVDKDNETYKNRQVGNLVQDERQKMAIYWTEKKLQSDISSYIDAGGDGMATANAIMELKNRSMELKNRSAKKPNAENYLKKCQRWLVFSEKDRRAQQVYETYKNIEKNLNIITNDDILEPQYKMYALDKVHSINTPCGWGCF